MSESVRQHVPAGWNLRGDLPILPDGPPLHIDDPAGTFELDVHLHDESFVGGARLDDLEFSIHSSSQTAIREWVIGALAMVQQRA